MSTTKARVLHVYSGNLFGGVERVLINLIGDQSQIEHKVALCFEGTLADSLSKIGQPPSVIGPAGLTSPLKTYRAKHALKKLVRELSPHALIYHDPWVYSLLSIPHPNRFLWMHTDWRVLDPLFLLSYLKGVDGFIANGAYLQNRLQAVTQQKSIYRVPCPIHVKPINRSLEARQAAKQAYGLDPNKPLMLMAGRLHWIKGHDVFVKAFKTITSETPCQALIQGVPRSEDEKSFLAHLKKSAMNDLFFLEKNVQIEDLLTAADIYCQPNLEPETFGMLLAEAAASGVPVATSDIGGAMEIFSGFDEALVEPDSTPALCQRILTVFSSPKESQTACEKFSHTVRKLYSSESANRVLLEIITREHDAP